MTALPPRRLALDDMDEVALVHRAAFDDRLPWLAGRHTPAQDRWFFRHRVFEDSVVWGAGEATLVGFIAFREGWIDHLYVMPGSQGQGVGRALVRVAQAAWPRLELWTFARNTKARRFYESLGFVAAEQTDGQRNEEREPDVRYVWVRPTPPESPRSAP